MFPHSFQVEYVPYLFGCGLIEDPNAPYRLNDVILTCIVVVSIHKAFSETTNLVFINCSDINDQFRISACTPFY